MRKNKHLAATIATAVAVTMIAGTSAFAETRHRQETHQRGEARDTVRRERSAERPRSDESRNYERRSTMSSSSPSARGEQRRDTYRDSSTYRREVPRETYRSDSTRRSDSSYRRGDSSSRGGDSYRRGDSSSRGGDSYRRGDSSSRGGYSNRGNGTYRGDNRSYGSRSYGHGQPFYHRGAVSRYSRYGGGYRVWVIGAPYPFYVPLAYWSPSRFRIGLTINLGGYYNPGGYYDYYDGYDRYDGYAYRSDSRGDLRGVVESVDYRRDTFVVRNDASGSFVTVIARDREGRSVRPGDYVEITGTWTRGGLFSAYDVDLLDNGYRDRY